MMRATSSDVDPPRASRWARTSASLTPASSAASASFVTRAQAGGGGIGVNDGAAGAVVTGRSWCKW